MSVAPARLTARALLLGERLDHRALARAGDALADPIPLAAPEGVTGFGFRWGAVVLFGATPAQEALLLERLRPQVQNPLPVAVDERARIEAGAEEDGVDAAGTIRLRDLSLARLAVVADALAKSAALSQQEATLAQTLDGMEPIVAALRSRGRLVASSRSLLRSIGSALSARSRATARVQAEDKPEVLWDHPELERLYLRLADEFELTERSVALDRKLALIGETTQTLLSLIEARRSLGLEVAIVALVGIEVVVTLYNLFRP